MKLNEDIRKKIESAATNTAFPHTPEGNYAFFTILEDLLSRMHSETIVAKVAELRALQKRFFQGDKQVLLECKRLEKEIDKMIADHQSAQTTLF